jgi:hypothetical protein
MGAGLGICQLGMQTRGLEVYILTVYEYPPPGKEAWFKALRKAWEADLWQMWSSRITIKSFAEASSHVQPLVIYSRRSGSLGTRLRHV